MHKESESFDRILNQLGTFIASQIRAGALQDPPRILRAIQS